MTDLPAPQLPEPVPAHLEGLTDLQMGFVCHFVTNGGKKGKAARAAGYADSCASQVATRLIRNPLIIQAIHHESVLRFGSLAAAAVRTTEELLTRGKSEYVRATVAADVLDRLGMTAPKKVQVSGGVSVQINLD